MLNLTVFMFSVSKCVWQNSRRQHFVIHSFEKYYSSQDRHNSTPWLVIPQCERRKIPGCPQQWCVLAPELLWPQKPGTFSSGLWPPVQQGESLQHSFCELRTEAVLPSPHHWVWRSKELLPSTLFLWDPTWNVASSPGVLSTRVMWTYWSGSRDGH